MAKEKNGSKVFNRSSFLFFVLVLLSACNGGGSSGGAPAVAAETSAPENLILAISSHTGEDPCFDLPLARLQEALLAVGFKDVQIQEEIPQEPAHGTILIGEADDFNPESLDGITPEAMELDGYWLKGQKKDDRSYIHVLGKGNRGVVYAIHELRRQLLTGGGDPIFDSWESSNTPSIPYRYTTAVYLPNEPPLETQLMDPDEVLQMGYNGVILFGLSDLCTLDNYDPTIYAGLDAMRAVVDKDRAYIRDVIRAAKTRHLDVFLDGDMLTLPAPAVFHLDYNDLVTHDNELGILCPGKNMLYELIEASIDELFTLFPEVDGLQIRLGEVYDFKVTVWGNSPIEGSCPYCVAMEDDDKLSRVVEKIRQVVVDKHGKRFNARMWGYYNTAHAVPDRYLSICDQVTPGPKMTFSFKQPRTDYWRYNAFNPNFGVGNHGQWAEFQCQREYEGKASFPLYMGRYFAEGGPELLPMGGVKNMAALGVEGAWAWSRGGGWGGPSVQREDWAELNTFALGALLWDPDRDPYEIAGQWLRLKQYGLISSKMLTDFIEILKLTEEALLKTRYVEAYALQHVLVGNGWTPSENWMRDDMMTGMADKIARKLYDSGDLAEAIAEKEDALLLADQILALWEGINLQVQPNESFWEELYHSGLYGDSWFRVAAHYFLAAFHYTDWKNSGSAVSKDTALFHLARWEEQWTRHIDDIQLLNGVASSFQNDGMEEFCQEMLEALE